MIEPTKRFTPISTMILATTMAVGLVMVPGTASADGETTFQTVCVACHTIGGGRLVGPDLLNIRDRRTDEWIVEFVQHSQQMVNDGDPQAVAIFEEYARVPMPDQPLSDAEVMEVIAYIAEAGGGEGPAPVEYAQATPEQIVVGQELFEGSTRLTNGGPPCNSCHDIAHDAVIGGGVLARELTTVFGRLGEPGVRAILNNLPFPVMEQAYEDKPLTDEEVVSLVGFLQKADAEQALHQPRDYGIKLFLAGLVGTIFLFGLYSLLWRGRRRGSVNQEIFDRQVKSM